jgi:hypothetical protein
MKLVSYILKVDARLIKEILELHISHISQCGTAKTTLIKITIVHQTPLANNSMWHSKKILDPVQNERSNKNRFVN